MKKSFRSHLERKTEKQEAMELMTRCGYAIHRIGHRWIQIVSVFPLSKSKQFYSWAEVKNFLYNEAIGADVIEYN